MEALISFIAGVAMAAEVKIGTFRTDEGGEFEGRFQEKLDTLEIY